MDRADTISVKEICAMLNARVAELAPQLLSAGRPDQRRKFFEAGSVDGEAGQSLKLNLTGANQGRYTDFSAAEGTWRYSGDVLTLAQHNLFGGDKGKAVAWAKSLLGLDDLDPARIARVRREAEARIAKSEKQATADAERNRSRAWHMWKGAAPIAGTAAEAYLRGRGLDFTRLGKLPGSLRFLPDCWCAVRQSKHPAMIACIMALNGNFLAAHRTYLDVSAGKNGPVTAFKVPDKHGRPKSHKQSLGVYFGGCIPLWKGASAATLREIPRGTPVYVSEGIEDGLTVALAFPDRRVVAGVALANMGGLILPAQAGPLIFIGQRDPIDGKALEAFERAVARQQEQAAAQGRPMPEIIWPGEGFKDFNDQLLGKRMAEAGA